MLVEPTMKHLARLTLASAFAVILTMNGGCALVDPGPDDRASFRLTDEGLEIAVCADIVVHHGWVQYSSGDVWHTAWAFTGDLPLRAGDTFFPEGNTLLDMSDGERQLPQLAAGEGVDILLSNDGDSPYEQIWANFLLEDDLAVDGLWVHADGSTGELPCA